MALALLCSACNVDKLGEPAPVRGVRWEFATPGLPLAAIRDTQARDYLYVAQKEGGLLFLRLQSTAPPVQAAILAVSAFDGLHVTSLAQRGTRLFVGLGDFFSAQGSRTGLAVVDVQNPAQPAVVARWISSTTMTGSTAVMVNGDFAYLAAKRDGVFIFDLARSDTVRFITSILPDPDFPKPGPSSTEHPNARGMDISGNMLFLANDAGGVRVIDITDPANPRELAKYINRGVVNKPQAYNAIVVQGSLAYVPLDYCGLEILDVSNPLAIRQLGWWNPWRCETAQNTWFNSAGHTNQIVVDPQSRLAYVSAGASELVVLDVSDPSDPVLAWQYEYPSGDQAVWGLAVGSEEVYLTYIVALIPYRGTWSGIRAISITP